MAATSMGHLRAELLDAVARCSARGLTYSAKWAAELAVSIDVPEGDALAIPAPEAEDPAEYVILQLAKVYFDLSEFDRSAHVLRGCRSDKAFFLRCYAKYLAGEKRKEESVVEVLGDSDGGQATNKELLQLSEELAARAADNALDAFGWYLWGVVLKEQKCKTEAMEKFASAVCQYPLLWSAWFELVNLCADAHDKALVLSLNLPNHAVRDFFEALLVLELHENEEALACYEQLGVQYPGSLYVKAQTAVAFYNQREYDLAKEKFAELRRDDRFRLDNIDTYSNILFVQELKPDLSNLAHEACSIDQYRAETCCVVGNYYSLKNHHEKAVTYFQRALRLNPRYLSAWTLMGHEYVELKNVPAAIAAYRRAVDINPRDYRAWYGLGQTYELLTMPLYSIYYYRQAQKLRPYDSRMWSALAHTYKAMGRWLDAAECYERARTNDTGDFRALIELAIIYRDRILPRDMDKAAHYFQLAYDLYTREEGASFDSEHTLEACMFLANYHKDKGELVLAKKFATKLMDYNGKYREVAKTVLKQLDRMQSTSLAAVHRDSGPEDTSI